MNQPDSSFEFLSDRRLAEELARKSVREAVEERKERGLPIAKMRKGRPTFVDAIDVHPRGSQVPQQLASMDAEKLEQLLGHLPDQVRVICRLYLILCYNCTEIAKLLSIETQFVQKELRRGEEMLVSMTKVDPSG